MQIEKNFKMIFSDTPVPDIFIAEYLPELSAQTVKLYIYSLLLAHTKRVITESDIEARIGTDKEGIRVSLTELAAFGLISFTDRGFTVEDIKEIEIGKMYKQRTSISPSDSSKSLGQNSKDKVMSDISKTFFSGLMSPSWYNEIENWFEKYRFEPQVVYALFNECKRRKKLDSKAYISKVASNWASHGVVTYDDLNRYSVTFDKITALSRKIGQKMRKNITEYDEELISKWVEKMQYDFDIIDIALRKTSKLSNPNLEYANKLLEEWFSRQLKSVDAIMTYETEKSLKFRKQGSDSSSSIAGGKRSNVANFEQRKYSDEYFEMMIEDLPVVPDLKEDQTIEK